VLRRWGPGTGGGFYPGAGWPGPAGSRVKVAQWLGEYQPSSSDVQDASRVGAVERFCRRSFSRRSTGPVMMVRPSRSVLGGGPARAGRSGRPGTTGIGLGNRVDAVAPGPVGPIVGEREAMVQVASPRRLTAVQVGRGVGAGRASGITFLMPWRTTSRGARSQGGCRARHEKR